MNQFNFEEGFAIAMHFAKLMIATTPEPELRDAMRLQTVRTLIRMGCDPTGANNLVGVAVNLARVEETTKHQAFAAIVW